MKLKNNYIQHSIKLIAGFSQLTTILLDFLCSCFIYLIHCLNHATKHTQFRSPLLIIISTYKQVTFIYINLITTNLKEEPNVNRTLIDY